MESPVVNTLPILTDRNLLNWKVRDENSIDDRLNHLRQPILAKMVENGVLNKEILGSGDVYVINDIEGIKRGGGIETKVNGVTTKRTLSRIIDNVAEKIKDNQEFGKGRTDRTLYFIFKDLDVFSKEDFLLYKEGKDIKPKKLFYIPANSEAGLSPEKIREKNGGYYLLFSDVSSNLLDTSYPTLDADFDSNLTMFEGAVSCMIYGKGGATRKSDGSLNVSQNLDPDGAKQRISGNWFKKNFHLYKIGNTEWANPKRMVEIFGGKMIERGLLKPDDFVEHDFNENSTDSVGQFYYEGCKFYLGREHANAQVRNIYGKTFAVVNKDGDIKFTFRSEIKDENSRHLIRVHSLGKKGRSTLYIPKEVYIRTEADRIESINIITYNSDKIGITRLDGKTSLENLISFKEKYLSRNIPDNDLDRFSFEEQIIISQVFLRNRADDSNLWKFVDTFGYSGLQLIINEYSQNGDLNHLDLLNLPREEMNSVIDSYAVLQDSIDELGNSFTESIPNNLNTKDIEAYKQFTLRIIEALKIRSNNLISLATSVDLSTLNDQFLLLNSATNCIAEALIPDSNLKRGNVIDYKNSRATQIFESDIGETLVVTIRPSDSEDFGEEGHGQARIQFRYKNKKEDELNIRVDLDQFGASLDIGSRGQKIVELLKQSGNEYHTRVIFENRFSDPNTFARMAKIFSSSIGINKWK